MRGSSIDLQLTIHGITQLCLREHPADCLLNHTGWPLGTHDLETTLAKPTRVAAMAAIELLVVLPTRDTDGSCVDYDNMVADIEEGRVTRFVLPLKQFCRSGRDSTKDPRLCVDDVPPTIDLMG